MITQKNEVIMISENSLVRYKNSLNKASYDLDAFELRIILAAVAQLPPGKLASDCLLTVEASDLEMIGVDPKNAYSALKKATKSLFNRYIAWEYFDEDGRKEEVNTRWLQEVAYLDQAGRLKLQFSNRVAKHLDRLLPNITQFAYLDLHSLSSSYAIRLYQQLAQFQHSQKYFVSVDELRTLLALGDKYPQYGIFKKKVLDVAIKQINEAPFTAFKVRMSDKERGCKDSRKVVKLHFYILPKDKTQPNPVINVEPNEVDKTTGDLFAGGLSLNRAKLSPKQIAMYADFLSGKNGKYEDVAQSFYADCRNKGMLNWFSMSKEQCAQDLANKMADPHFVIAIYDWLKRVGFGG